LDKIKEDLFFFHHCFVILFRERENVAHEQVQRALVRDDDHLRHAEPLEHGLHAIRLLAAEPVGWLVEDDKVAGLHVGIFLDDDVVERQPVCEDEIQD
jgi:hypothetical protein